MKEEVAKLNRRVEALENRPRAVELARLTGGPIWPTLAPSTIASGGDVLWNRESATLRLAVVPKEEAKLFPRDITKRVEFYHAPFGEFRADFVDKRATIDANVIQLLDDLAEKLTGDDEITEADVRGRFLAAFFKNFADLGARYSDRLERTLKLSERDGTGTVSKRGASRRSSRSTTLRGGASGSSVPGDAPSGGVSGSAKSSGAPGDGAPARDLPSGAAAAEIDKAVWARVNFAIARNNGVWRNTWVAMGEVKCADGDEKNALRQLALTYQYYVCSQWEKMKHDQASAKEYRNRRMPMLLLLLTKSRLSVYGGIWTGRETLVQYLGDAYVAVRGSEEGGRLLRAVHRYLTKSSSGANALLGRENPEGEWHIPTGYRITYLNEVMKGRPAVFQARVSDPKEPANVREAVVKICGSYNVDAHRRLARAGRAPQLYHEATVFGGWRVLVMEHIADGNLAAYLKKKRPLEDTDRQQLAHILATLHASGEDAANGYVCGDFRPENILLRKKRREENVGSLEEESEVRQWLLCDFDWVGPAGEARYPVNLNPSIKWPTGAIIDNVIEKAHDIGWLARYLMDGVADYNAVESVPDVLVSRARSMVETAGLPGGLAPSNVHTSATMGAHASRGRRSRRKQKRHHGSIERTVSAPVARAQPAASPGVGGRRRTWRAIEGASERGTNQPTHNGND